MASGTLSLGPNHSPSMPDDIPGVEVMPLEDAFRQGDYVVTLTPLNDKTRGFVNARTLAWMKPGAYLINASRGGVVDEAALADCLRAGRIAGAALDVFATEPIDPNHPFFDLPNLILTPHIAGLSVESFRELSIRSVAEVERVLVKGERPGMVFNVSYGIQGQARYTHVPSILEMVGVPYVASGPLAHSLALDKVVTKMILRQHDLPLRTLQCWSHRTCRFRS